MEISSKEWQCMMNDAALEADLRRIFGEQYDLYRQTGRVDAARRFSFERVMANREYRAVIGLAIAVLLLAWKATYNGSFGGTLGEPFIGPGGQP